MPRHLANEGRRRRALRSLVFSNGRIACEAGRRGSAIHRGDGALGAVLQLAPRVDRSGRAGYRLRPSIFFGSSSCGSMPSRHRTLIATIGVPSGLVPRAKDSTPQTLQNT